MDRIYIHCVGTVQYYYFLTRKDPLSLSIYWQDFLLCYPCP